MCHFTQTRGGRRNCANPAEQAPRGPVRPFLPAPPRTTREGGHICFSVSPSECPHSGLGAGRPFPPNTLALPLPGGRRLMGGKHTSMNLSAAFSSVNSKRGALASQHNRQERPLSLGNLQRETILKRAELRAGSSAPAHSTGESWGSSPHPAGSEPQARPPPEPPGSPRATTVPTQRPRRRAPAPASPGAQPRRGRGLPAPPVPLLPAPKRAWEPGVVPGAAHDGRLRAPGRTQAPSGPASSPPPPPPAPVSTSSPPSARGGRRPGSAPRRPPFRPGTAAATSHPGSRRRRRRRRPGAWRELLRGRGPGRRAEGRAAVTAAEERQPGRVGGRERRPRRAALGPARAAERGAAAEGKGLRAAEAPSKSRAAGGPGAAPRGPQRRGAGALLPGSRALARTPGRARGAGGDSGPAGRPADGLVGPEPPGRTAAGLRRLQLGAPGPGGSVSPFPPARLLS